MKRRAFWFIKLRWFVPILIVGGAVAARLIGFQFSIWAILSVSAFIYLYNIIFHKVGNRVCRRSDDRDDGDNAILTHFLHAFTYIQVALDYASIFLLVHFTGGATSPLLFFFFFHIIFAAILLTERASIAFAGVAAIGMIVMALLDWYGIVANSPLIYQGDQLKLPEKLWYLNAKLAFFVPAIFITAISTSLIMKILKRQIVENALYYEQAEQLTEERWRFMRKASHNLRAPLNAVMSMLELLKDEYFGPLTTQQREHLRRIHRRTKTMADMLKTLMAIAKSRAQTRVQVPTPMLVKDIAGRLSRTFEDRAMLKGLGLVIHVSDDLSKTHADLELLEPVAENLISNAIKYTYEGEVRVDFGMDEALLKLTVVDTGIGIPDGDKERLFEEFFRARNAKVIEEIGTGLGLSFVREAVAQKGGRVEWESEEGKGTRFDVYLPTLPSPGQ